MILTSTADLIKIITSSAADIHVQANWVDNTDTLFTPGRTNTIITSATTTTVVGSPAASTQRQVKSMAVSNEHASTPNTVTIQFYDGTTSVIVASFTLSPADTLYYDGVKWSVFSPNPVSSLIVLTGVETEPSTPSAGQLQVYSKSVSGRMMLKVKGPSGLDWQAQPALFGNNVVLYVPNTATSVGLNFGTPWVAGTTVSHPQPTSGIYTQMKRTVSANVITTPNQALGVSSIASTAAQFYRGNAAGLGGFFFFARFGFEILADTAPNATRLFVGLQSGTTNILVADTVPAISCIGLWHDTTDDADTIKLLTKNGTTATKNTLDGSPTTPYSTGQAYDFFMFAKPNDSVVYYRLDNMNTGATLCDSSISVTLPLSTVFMGPVVGMSNGTANIVAAKTAIGVNRIYVESDH